MFEYPMKSITMTPKIEKSKKPNVYCHLVFYQDKKISRPKPAKTA